MIKAAILTTSDNRSKGQRVDLSERTSKDILKENSNAKADVVLATGGTRLGPRDAKPETTVAVSEKMVPGLWERTRLKSLEKTPNAMLSQSG